MATSGGRSELLRDFRRPQQASYVELFLDVVYVYALVRLTALLAEDLSWHVAYQSLLLLAIWWVWYRIAWTTNRYNPARPVIQVMVILVMLSSLLMATALPKAFTDWGLLFALIYVGTQVIRYLWLVLLVGDQAEQRASACILFWALLSAGPWLIGAVQNGTARAVWWSVALCLDYLSSGLDFPAPRLGRAGLRQHQLAEGHLTDRYRQFLIIAFGETILASGREFRAHRFEEIPTRSRCCSRSPSRCCCGRSTSTGQGRCSLRRSPWRPLPPRVGELAWYSHLTMMAGVALSGVGDRLIIIGPLGRSGLAHVLVIFGGPALYLVGRAVLDYADVQSRFLVAAQRDRRTRPLAPAALWLPPIATAALAAAVLVGVATANILAWRLYPGHPPHLAGQRTEVGPFGSPDRVSRFPVTHAPAGNVGGEPRWRTAVAPPDETR